MVTDRSIIYSHKNGFLLISLGAQAVIAALIQHAECVTRGQEWWRLMLNDNTMYSNGSTTFRRKGGKKMFLETFKAIYIYITHLSPKSIQGVRVQIFTNNIVHGFTHTPFPHGVAHFLALEGLRRRR
jgi:hypothetical protein